ncbi:uncharacterized protein LOC122634206 [Vespula pensylvanica]|uniref:uncharacterized protein LOC122634206 n=1 Tax=Vespula pensylvanica TaxID=30213 RepID=UPI001CB9D940|nr:uncharacterized protein LOC122634206 [Vespula pensylvanica]
MGTIKNEMEAADTSTFSLSSRKDLLTKIKKKNDKNNSNGRANKDLLSDLTSGSFLTNELRKSNDNDLVSSFTSLPLESYGFPYYRSYKNGGRSQDAVLVKDIGISCKLLNEKMLSHNFSKDTIVESYLIKRLKTEYNDLTEITKKISSYTNDIIRNLILRDRKKKEQIRSCGHKVLTEEETKEGYLKLRLKSDAEVRCLYRKDLFDSSKEKFNDDSTITLVNGFLQDTNFHTVNIRILKHEQS